MINKSTSYRVVNLQTGEVAARGSKRNMLKLLREMKKDVSYRGMKCAVYFHGIPVEHLEVRP